jgi:hypothetical protein
MSGNVGRDTRRALSRQLNEVNHLDLYRIELIERSVGYAGFRSGGCLRGQLGLPQ